MKEIIVVSLNPAVDRNYEVSGFYPGKLYRCKNPKLSAGGKGINVARVISLLGRKVTLTGFFAGESGKYIIDETRIYASEIFPVFTSGNTRTTVNILDTKTGEETEMLEEGPVISHENLQNLTKIISSLLDRNKNNAIIIFSGGIPKGVPEDIYKSLIYMAKEKGALCFLDTSSSSLAEGIKAIPFFIKPNSRELFQIAGGRHFEDSGLPDRTFLRDEICSIKTRIRDLNIPYIAVTLGKNGAFLISSDCIMECVVPEINKLNSIGSGDSFTAGFAYEISLGRPPEKALVTACACGISNAAMSQTGTIDPDNVKKTAGELRINIKDGNGPWKQFV